MWDNLTDTCPECGVIGMFAKDVFGNTEFVHKVPSPNLEGYETFQSECVTNSL